MKIKQDEMGKIAKQILAQKARIVTLTGSLGAGKTTLVQEILKQLGVQEIMQSPTYTYVSLYKTAGNQTVYHFDLYRLNNLDEFIQAGFDEYLYQEDALCFIEWPKIIEPLLISDVCSVVIEYVDEDTRFIRIT